MVDAPTAPNQDVPVGSEQARREAYDTLRLWWVDYQIPGREAKETYNTIDRAKRESAILLHAIVLE